MLDADDAGELALKLAAHGEQRRRHHFAVAGLEHHVLDAAAEFRAVDAFAGDGEQHLLDELLDVVVVRRRLVDHAAMQGEGKVQVHFAGAAGGAETYICCASIPTPTRRRPGTLRGSGPSLIP